MPRISLIFFAAGGLAALLGMVWGIQMSASGDHTLSPAHAHLNLVGWASFGLFGAFYALAPGAAEGRLPKVHAVLAIAGLATLVPGIVLAITAQGESLAKIGSVLSLGSMVLFLVIVLRALVRAPRPA